MPRFVFGYLTKSPRACAHARARAGRFLGRSLLGPIRFHLHPDVARPTELLLPYPWTDRLCPLSRYALLCAVLRPWSMSVQQYWCYRSATPLFEFEIRNRLRLTDSFRTCSYRSLKPLQHRISIFVLDVFSSFGRVGSKNQKQNQNRNVILWYSKICRKIRIDRVH